MASLGRLLCVVGLLLCGAASLGLCKSHTTAAKNPIIGKKAVRGPQLGSDWVSEPGLQPLGSN